MFIFLTLNILLTLRSGWTGPVPDLDDYWTERQSLLKEDLSKMIGNDVVLSTEEEIANSILMQLKWQEFGQGFSDLDFAPSKNFFLARDQIDSSRVFSMIKQMPKGAVLHTHDVAMTSIDWVVQNLTYWSDLYMCYTAEEQLRLHFFDTPNADCNWEKVSDVRASYPTPEDFDSVITKRLSLFTDPAEYADINSVWSAFEGKLIAISELLGYTEAWKEYLYRAFLEYMQDGVTYMEFRGTLPQLYEKNGTILSFIDTYRVYEEVIQKFTSDHQHSFFGVKFIYAPLRRVSNDTMWNIVHLASELYETFPNTVAGFDLVGQEDLGFPLKEFIDQLLYITERKIPIFFHAGETTWEGMSTDENIIDALLLNTTRIGHGYAITKHPKLKQLAKERDIPLEVCPVSNQVLMLVSDLRNHPVSSLIMEDYPIVISSDDPGTWGAKPISHDFYEALMGLGGKYADLRFLKKLAMNSIKYSSLNEDQKTELMNMWQDQWDQFISSVNNLTNLTYQENC